MQKYIRVMAKNLHHTCIPLHKAILEKIPKELLEALIHPTWYRQLGPTKIRYVLAILILEKVLNEEATSTKIAQLVGVKPPSVSRPLKQLKEKDKVIHQDKTRGPYRVREQVAEDLFKLRSAKGEFDRDEVAKRKVRNQRRFFQYQEKLGSTILRFMEEDGLDPDHALKQSEEVVFPPKGIDEYELVKRQMWALNWAKREKREQKRRRDTNGSDRTGGARKAEDDARLREDIKENHFREGEGDG